MGHNVAGFQQFNVGNSQGFGNRKLLCRVDAAAKI